jgi:hypothetical protein
VTVLDTQAPELPANCLDDIEITLEPGACCIPITFIDPVIIENCTVDSILYSPASGSEFCTGMTEVTLIAKDNSGNADTCTFNVNIIPHEPDQGVFVCNGNINLSLGTDCTATVTPDMILEGGFYGCYDDYCVTVTNAVGDTIPNATFDLSHVGGLYTVSVSDCTEGGNSCWGTILLEEKLIPEIECPEDITISCIADYEDFTLTGNVLVTTCEQNLIISNFDSLAIYDTCDDPRADIFRTWIVTDFDTLYMSDRI